jgi:glycosyltransferase involved in cell wall biosynthesis
VLIGVGIPVFDNVPGESLAPFMKAAVEVSRFGEVRIISPVGVVPYHNARNVIIEAAQEVDYLLFIDADTVVPSGFFEKMMNAIKSGYVIANAHSYRRGFPYTCIWSKVPAPGKGAVPVDALSGTHEIDSGGFGLTLIDWNWCKQNLTDFLFRCLESGVGEDGMFYTAVRKVGGRVAGCADVRCGHIANRMIVNDRTAKILRTIEE